VKLHESYARKTVLYFTLHLSPLFQMQYATYYAFCNSLQLNHFLFCNHLTLFLSKSLLNSLPILPLPSSFKEISSKLFFSSSLPIPFLFSRLFQSIITPSCHHLHDKWPQLCLCFPLSSEVSSRCPPEGKHCTMPVQI